MEVMEKRVAVRLLSAILVYQPVTAVLAAVVVHAPAAREEEEEEEAMWAAVAAEIPRHTHQDMAVAHT
jgi:hypothetical protein